MSRFAAVAAALALLVSGAAIGALGTYLVLDRPRGPEGAPQPGPTSFTKIMESRLELSDAQKKQIEELIRESRREADEIRRELRPRLERYLEATRGRFEALLTPEQRAKFHELYREDRRAERFFLENPPGPAPRGPGQPTRPGENGSPRDDGRPREDGPPR
jgi:Spy/CpxP family protein refolding chaperone